MKKLILFSILSVLLYSATASAMPQKAAAPAPKAAAPQEEAVAEVVRETLAAALAETLKETEATKARRQAALASIEASLKEMPAERVAATKEAAAAPPARQMDAAVREFQEQVTTSCGRLVTALQARGDKRCEHSKKIRRSGAALRRMYFPFGGLNLLIPVKQEPTHDDRFEKLGDMVCNVFDKKFLTLDEEDRRRDLTESALSTIMQPASDLQPAVVAPAWQALQYELPVEYAIPVETAEEVKRLGLDVETRADVRQAQNLNCLLDEMDACQRQDGPPVMNPQAIANVFIEAARRMGDLTDEIAIASLGNLQSEVDHAKKLIALSIIEMDYVKEAFAEASRCHEVLYDEATTQRKAADASTPESTGAAPDMESPLDKFGKCNALLAAFNNRAEEIHRRYSKDATRLQKLFNVLRESSDSVSLVKALRNFEEVAEVPETPRTVQAEEEDPNQDD